MIKNNKIDLEDNQLKFDENNFSTDLKEKVQQRVLELEKSYFQESLPHGFQFRNGWLEYQPTREKEEDASPIRVCTRLEVIARTRDSENLNHGRLIRFWDPDGICHEWAMPMRLFASDGKEYRAELLDRGLIISNDKSARSLLGKYIQSAATELSIRCVSQTEWFDDLFVLHDCSIGNGNGESVVFQSEHISPIKFSTLGTLDDFQNISRLATGNDLMIFVLCLAFSPPLLQPLDIENGGFNLVGPSSIGKSKLLKLAASVWGPLENVQQWRATSNGLEGVAQSFNDCLLCLDELGQIASTDLGSTIYMLGNGVAKTRGQKTGGLRKPGRWRLLYLSSGELGISDHIRAANQQSRVGQEIRVIDLKTGNRKFGCFDHLHGIEDGADFSLLIEQMVSKTYGISGKCFLERLISRKNEAVSFVKKVMVDLKNTQCPSSSSGQIYRAFEKFALIAATGELATAFGITGWEKGVPINAILNIFHHWLEDRGNLGNKEEQQVLDQVSLFFEKHWASRFINVDEPDMKVFDCAGYRQKNGDEWEFFVYPNVYKNEVCKGFDPKYVTEVCKKHGFLVSGKKGEACPTWRPPGESSKRFYHFSKTVLPRLEGSKYDIKDTTSQM